ncbi:RNA-binding CRS1 / YhbY (CRM) domain protein [Melia azedarach]|uniref:RNA-binding CRS1 / YhbY (CRM) domain protein n=1 Tax=Melia azedarach TaxID=155640 RepID=A0ACC1Z2Y6_MELAZ|nr:RNA-binding CRS1 / YhbY (CRM) domain protein [Melia azedarach]
MQILALFNINWAGSDSSSTHLRGADRLQFRAQDRYRKRETEKMVGRVLVSSGSLALRKSHQLKILFSGSIFNPLFSNKCPLRRTSLVDVMCKAYGQESALGPLCNLKMFPLDGCLWIHSAPFLNSIDKVVEQQNHSEKSKSPDGVVAKVKRKKVKGKRAVVRWLKFFRWKKKKEYERMTAEEKLLYKLRKARKKEQRYVEALKKLEPKESSATTHDPEILTPEEHFFFLKMGHKCKNYVPVGRRGIYQGVILNMHLHWKKHQTLKVVVKTFSAEEVKEIAAELARLTGGIVLDIHEENEIIMYRGKNYSQPPTEIMSPRVTLSRKKALDKSKYRDGLRAVRKYVPKLEQELELLRAQAERGVGNRSDAVEDTQNMKIDNVDSGGMKECSEDDATTDLIMASDSEDLSDIFETDSEAETEEKTERPLYLHEFENIPVESDEEHEDFEEHLRQISMDSRNAKSMEKDGDSPNFDEVDRMFLRAASLLKKKRR